MSIAAEAEGAPSTARTSASLALSTVIVAFSFAVGRLISLRTDTLPQSRATHWRATFATDQEVRMRTINHRELRNNSSEVLRAVRSGETIEVTNHGEVAAVLMPPALTAYERLVAAGKVREPRSDLGVDLRTIRRVHVPLSSSAIIADVRGDR